MKRRWVTGAGIAAIVAATGLAWLDRPAAAQSQIYEELSQDYAAEGAAVGQAGLDSFALDRAIAELGGDTPPAAAEAAITTRYRPSAAVSARVAETLATESEKLAAGSGAEMRQMVTSGHPMREYAKVARELGLAQNDAADALAFYVLAQWGVATDYRERITRGEMAAVRAQVRAAFPSISGELQTDAKRQEFAETLINQGIITAGIHEAAVAAGMAERVAELSEMARRGGTKLFGRDPAEFELTPDGLVPRR